jgi:hypothetical protein
MNHRVEDIDEFDGEILEVTIEAAELPARLVVAFETESPETTVEEARLLLLSKGRTERDDPTRIVEPKRSPDGSHKLLVTADENEAIGIYLQVLEQHGKPPAIEEQLEDAIDMDAWAAWRDAFTVDDRRARLLAQARDRAHRSPHVERYLEQGSWRSVQTTEQLRAVGSRLYNGIDANPRECYRNSVVVLNAVEELEAVSYVEGLAMPQQGGRAVPHAWLELNESVIELTWPWHAPVPDPPAIYFGVPVETAEVIETVRRRGGNFTPVFLTPEEIGSQTQHTG